MRSFSRASLVLGAALFGLAAIASTEACAKFGQLKGAKAFKAANQAYQQQDYKKAAESYQATIEADPASFPEAYFYLANCQDNLYKPSKKGDAENDALLQNAVNNYQTAAEKLMADQSADQEIQTRRKKLGQLSLQYLVAAYGPDKLNDPGKAEPVLQHMIQLDPGETANYFMLARLYDDAGVPDEAERMYLAAKDARPNDPTVYTTLAAYYNRQGQFDKTIDALEERASKEPNNPEAYHTIASYYWDKANKDSSLKEAQKREYITKGIAAIDHALQIKPDYYEAMVYKGLLLRLEANIEKNPATQQQLLKDANELKDKAEDIRRKKAAGAAN